MIKILNINKEKPYAEFESYFEAALTAQQSNIEAISISSYCPEDKEVESRFVNLKFIKNNEWIFFSNYNSKKSKNFQMHDQISVLLFWNKINIQIRIKAKISRTSDEFSDQYFKSRDKGKNALAISSMQSSPIESYQDVKNNFNTVLNLNKLNERPAYWGGFSFIPYYFEFWEGHESRLNKRDSYQMNNGEWHHSILQP